MNNDINKYYLSLIQEISTRQLSNEDGDNQEQTFTRYVLMYCQKLEKQRMQQ